MAVFKKQFTDADEYEKWLHKAGGRINVLEIKNSPTIFGTTTQQPSGPVIVRYQTLDRSLAPPTIFLNKNVEAAIVAAGFLALSLYLMFEA
ncbi:MAG: hypothetical protein ACREQH_10585 [Candidatus Binatus sp.]